MGAKVYNLGIDGWQEETKEEVMNKLDIEGKKPCELCWEQARNGIYCFPVKKGVELLRCSCGRVFGVKTPQV